MVRRSGRRTPSGQCLLRQFNDTGKALLGEETWDQVATAIDQHAASQRQTGSATRLLLSLQVLLENHEAPLVLYLDNLESLLNGPDNADPEAIGEWRDAQAAALWSGLLDLQQHSGGRLALLASCRYRHEAFGRALLPFGPLPANAMWRLLGWFEALRRLAIDNRIELIK